MPDETVKPGIRLALRLHEIGDASPYRLSFAAKGQSGASFGFMQGDLAAHQPEVGRTFRQAMSAAGMSETTIAGLLRRLSVHLVANPLTPAETLAVNAALLQARAAVDAMDEAILGTVYAGLDRCSTRAANAGRRIAPKALIYMALWINMTGPPSKLLLWLNGADPGLRAPVPQPGAVVEPAAMEAYLRATDYFTENPGNLPHMLQSAAAGAAALA
jgi:hypothetical protein